MKSDMNKTDVLLPKAPDADSSDRVLCLNEDGDFELAQWWWVTDNPSDYPYWLPHPESPTAKHPDKNLVEAQFETHDYHQLLGKGFPIVCTIVRDAGTQYAFFEVPDSEPTN